MDAREFGGHRDDVHRSRRAVDSPLSVLPAGPVGVPGRRGAANPAPDPRRGPPGRGARLDGWWRRVDVDASCDGAVATVRVDATSSRSLLPSVLLRPTRLAELHRTFTVRVEVPR